MGDSITHYLLARHAWGSPELFLDHWGKPMFQLMMVIPAQFGIYGVVVVNGIFMLLALLAMADIARRQGIPGYPLLLLFGLLAPLVLRVSLSSLTEPVFAVLLAASIWGYYTRRFVLSAAIFSFLPFVRTEGMVYVLVWLFALAVVRQWRAMPWLLLGYVLFALAGWLWVHHDPWWFFSKMPYQHGDYGSGTFWYYFEVLYDILGMPILILFAWGVLVGGYLLLKRGWRLGSVADNTEYLLIYGVALSFITMHATFWYIGKMGSFGEIRIPVSVAPLMAYVAFRGWAQVWQWQWPRAWTGQLLGAALLIYVLVYNLTPHQAALRVQDFELMHEQLAAQRMRQYVHTHFPGAQVYTHWPAYLFVCDEHPHKRPNLPGFSEADMAVPGRLILWDDWFPQVDKGIKLERLTHYKLRMLHEERFRHWQTKPMDRSSLCGSIRCSHKHRRPSVIF